MKFFYDKNFSSNTNWGVQLTFGLEECGVEKNPYIFLNPYPHEVSF
jgi:hypothetical protein